MCCTCGFATGKGLRGVCDGGVVVDGCGDAGVGERSSGMAGSTLAESDTTTGCVGSDENGDGGGRTNAVDSRPPNGDEPPAVGAGGMTSVSYEGATMCLLGDVR
jgi:hypothetical protein